ncbi:hypothetical protein CDAR_450311 [Caerostris darwini]|uniref:Uncharacterized protein n=1 Tax=Caerostris darwini TaxID=1538125 RepID=A0AAV4SXT5_9ARAC|nr:hypothetical protein CDAR_450311 [Caerostris darwini]
MWYLRAEKTYCNSVQQTTCSNFKCPKNIRPPYLYNKKYISTSSEKKGLTTMSVQQKQGMPTSIKQKPYSHRIYTKTYSHYIYKNRMTTTSVEHKLMAPTSVQKHMAITSVQQK